MSKETKFCAHCGHANPVDAEICEQCNNILTATPTTNETPTNVTPTDVANKKPKGKASAGLIILTILFPIAGLVLFFTRKENGGKTYLTIFIVETIISVLLSFIAFAAIGAISKQAVNPPNAFDGGEGTTTSIIDDILNDGEETTAEVDGNDSGYQYYVPGENYDDIPSID